MKFLTNINLNQNEIQNAAMQNLATAPPNPVRGQFYYNTASGAQQIYNGTEWVPVSSTTLADLGVTVTASQINTAVTDSPSKAPLASPAFTGTPSAPTASSETNSTQLATTAFVQTALSGTGDMKKSVYDTDGDGIVDSAETLSGLTSTIAELNYTDGVTSNIQTQINAANTSISLKAPLASPALTGAPTAPTPASTSNDTQLATTAFVKSVISGCTGNMIFMGTVNSGTDISGLSEYSSGWNWVVGAAGTYVGAVCEVGDMIICVSDRGSAYSASDFTVIQTNINGGVTAASTLSDGYLVEGSGNRAMETGSILATNVVSSSDTFVSGEIITANGSKTVVGSGISAATSLTNSSVQIPTSSAVIAYLASLNLATVVTGTNTSLTASGGVCTWSFSHNLGTKNVTVSVYDISTGDDVICDITRTSTSVVTIKIVAASVAAETYQVVVTGVKA